MALRLSLIYSAVVLIFTGIITVNGVDHSQHISMVVTPHNETVYPGTDVTFTCSIELSSVPSPESTAVTLKKFVSTGDRDNIPLETVSILTALQGPYKTLGRFAVMRTTDLSNLIYTLTISGVQIEDSGSYSCSVSEKENMYSLATLRVYRPPAGISFPSFNGSTVVELTENQVPHNLECLVSHVMPEPDMKLTVDGRDITADSLVSTKVNAMCSNIVANKMCPLYQDYNVTVYPREYRPVYTDDGKELVCTSTMRAFNRTVSSTTVHLAVRYAPKIVCTQNPPVRVNTTNAALRCTVYGNPLLSYNRTWFVTIGSKNVSLQGNYDEFTLLERMDKSANPKQADMSLTIARALPTHFKYQYYLQVENEVGQATYPVQLKEELAGTSPGGAGSRVMSTLGWTTLMTSSFLLYIHRLF